MPIPLNPLLASRFSCRSYEPKTIDDEVLRSLFEAARWAPSSYNEQPWRFIVASRREGAAFEKMLHCLGGNQEWAMNAGALLACVVEKNFIRNGKPNPHAAHDLGLAVMSMAVQAVSLGLQMREMAGIERDKVREAYGVPADFEIVSGLAIGTPGDLGDYLAKRNRKSLDSFVFEDAWGKSFRIA